MTGMNRNLDRSGYALIMVLWVLVLLTISAMTFSMSTRLSTAMVRNFKEETIANYLAMAGYNMTLKALMTDKDVSVDFIDEKGRFYLDKESEPLQEDIHIPEGEVRVKVEDEEGRININYASETLLRRLFHYSGVDKEKENELIDSLKDWIDPDDAHRLNGAEDEYYEPLGYSTKNDRIDTIEELNLIKGFSRGILYGDEEHKGISSMITTFGTGGLNINTASRELMSLLGLSEIEIDGAMNQRTVTLGGYRLIPQRFTAAGFSKTATTYFRITVKATPRESNISYNIEAVIKRISTPKGFDTETLYWREYVLYSNTETKS